MTTQERFFSKVSVTPTCWNWTASVGSHGYGQFGFLGKNVLAHRYSWQLTNGDIPTGLTLDHLCRNKLCVNPMHLEPVTDRENILRGTGPSAVNAKKTSCNKGHSFTEANTYTKPSGKRECRQCRKTYNANYNNNNKEQSHVR